jgi:flavine halogenase
MFKHAAKSGAQAFDGVKVTSITFGSSSSNGNESLPGRPTSATYTQSSNGQTGQISFEYVIDASGRVGLLSTKYLKNRRYNQGLKNIANWGYWSGTKAYAAGTARENSPFFEALQGMSHLSFEVQSLLIDFVCPC